MCDNTLDITEINLRKAIADREYEASLKRFNQRRLQLNQKKVKKVGGLIELNPPDQPVPITIDNFFIATYGVFDELKEIPEGFKSFFKLKGSEYFTNEDKTQVIRVSDHWGLYIRFCDWFLKTDRNKIYDRISSFKWKKKHGKEKRIGIIHYKSLSVNKRIFGPKRVHPRDEKYSRITSRHPL